MKIVKALNASSVLRLTRRADRPEDQPTLRELEQMIDQQDGILLPVPGSDWTHEFSTVLGQRWLLWIDDSEE